MAETLDTKREGGARTMTMPMKRKNERVTILKVLETASLAGTGGGMSLEVSFLQHELL